MQKLSKISWFLHFLFFFLFFFLFANQIQYFGMQPFTHTNTRTRETHDTRHSRTLTSTVCSVRESKTIYLFSSVFLLAVSQISSLLHHSRSLHYYCCSVPIILSYLLQYVPRLLEVPLMFLCVVHNIFTWKCKSSWLSFSTNYFHLYLKLLYYLYYLIHISVFSLCWWW